MPQTEVILSTHDVTTSADKRRNQNVTMTLELPTEEQLARIYDELAMNPDTIERDVAYLKEWISKQPHLPNGIDDRFLRNSLIFRKNSLEKVKESVDLFYSVKSLAPELLSNRDPFDPALQGEMENLFFYPLPKLTQDGSRVIISKLFCTDPKMFYYPSAAKLVLMVAAVSLLEDRCLSHTIVFDLQGITMSHLATVQIPLARKFIYIGQNAYPIRQKAVHIIHAPSYVETMLSIFKPFLKKKLIDRRNGGRSWWSTEVGSLRTTRRRWTSGRGRANLAPTTTCSALKDHSGS
ncbi:alpha-tocopherol transfer protein-like isoform X3 [Anabrus simplex]|uniref:alpha-tocopherol transfer protein-like isoform X3 n=1 Tax=Anabrus simplex TaxID=316456 RepID=UPI0035A3C33F